MKVTTRDFNRKVVSAVTKEGLFEKITESEKRSWQVTGEIKQQANGHWACLMTKEVTP